MRNSDDERHAYQIYYELTEDRAKKLTAREICQLSCCKSDEARRLLLFGLRGLPLREKRTARQSHKFRSLAMPERMATLLRL